MAHDAVQQRRCKTKRRLRFTLELSPYLPKPEQVEVIDDERCREHESPAEAVRRVHQNAATGGVDFPYRPPERLPEPEQQSKSGVAGQNERAALCGLGKHARYH